VVNKASLVVCSTFFHVNDLHNDRKNKEQAIRSAHGYRCLERTSSSVSHIVLRVSQVLVPDDTFVLPDLCCFAFVDFSQVMTPPSTENLDDNSNIKSTEAVVALGVVVRRASCA
jgi:hypothetical protein